MKKKDELIRILNEEVRCYRSLLELLGREKDAIISFKPAVLEEIAKNKDTIILQIRLLDDERKRLVRELSRHYSTGTSLSDIYAATGDEEFLRIRSELVSILQCIEEINEINRIFIDRATLHIKTSAAYLQSVSSFSDLNSTVSREV